MSTEISTESTYSTALAYTRRGWTVIPVHGMREGECACRSGARCPHPGKHPMGREWQRREALSAADCYSLFAEPDPETGAMRNAGLVTGKVSGVWALDEDPKNGGDKSIATLEARYGKLPPTLVNRTGSGGRHFVFLMPDGMSISSGQWARGNGPFGPGIDVKADGGQIIIPGSVTDKGRYSTLSGSDVLPTPEWMLDLLRAPVVSGAAGAGAVEIEGLPWHGDLSETERDRLQVYAGAACKAALEGYVGAAPGHGSLALYRAAIGMIEIAQSPWNSIGLEQVREALERARARRMAEHPSGGGQTGDELRRAWNGAMERASGRGRPMPEHPDAGVRLDVPLAGGLGDEAGSVPGAVDGGAGISLEDLKAAGVIGGEGAGVWSGWRQLRESSQVEDGGCPDIDEVTAELDGIRDVESRKAYLRGIVGKLIECGPVEVMQWRDLCCAGTGALRRGEFDTLLREARKAAVAETELAEALARRRANAARAEAAREKGTLLPGPHAPLAVARELVSRWPSTGGVPHVAWWQGDWYEWDGTRWPALDDSALRQRLYLATEHAQFESKDGELSPWHPRRSSIGDLERALGEGVLQRPADRLDDRVIAFRNGVYDRDADVLTPHTPEVFNLTCLPYDYVPGATCPTWLAFLADVLPDDQGAIDFLQEWFGYVISGRTDLQKIADLVGAPRCGKGTIARTLHALIGKSVVAEPSLSSLATHFGLQTLIGKSLATMADVNWNIRELSEAVEVMKKISGEDSPDVHRKGREDWRGQLGVRFMIMGNDLPKFNDPSGALLSRMIHVRFKKSFLGSEDPTLGGKLMTELPGILVWALGGLKRLEERGRFLVHDSSRETAGEISRGISPVAGWMDDYVAIVNPDADPIPLDRLYDAFRRWCEKEEGREHVPVKNVFSQAMQSAGKGAISVKRRYEGVGKTGPRVGWVYGVAPAFLGAFDPPIGQGSGWLIGGGS